MSVGDDSIEGLLKNLKKTLDVDSKDKGFNEKDGDTNSSNVKKEPQRDSFVKNDVSNNEMVFVLKKKGEKAKQKEEDLLKKNVISHVESEVVRFVVSFCSSEEGISYIKSLISLSLESKDDLIKKTVKEEISKKIQEVLSSK
ncbi:hypothetical protein [Alphaproteobacteria bacterium endosymbiont of Tiliacea citrago]|uniref:hypothetical protein n=1 Tax=Alphaproteobacteria bacterium endosymbiont of Tiliacea citrago TaxID=3077944 RepID=UPI00313D3CD7